MSDEKPSPRFHRFECAQCGYAWVGRDSTCSACGGMAKSSSQEMTKKVIDDNDMKKAF